MHGDAHVGCRNQGDAILHGIDLSDTLLPAKK
jgi:hypothetical protein